MADMAMHTNPRIARGSAPAENRSAHAKGVNPASAEEQGKRLTEVRLKAGYRTRQEAADALGEPVASYHLRENGHRALTADVAKRYAEFFRVTAQWLLYGDTGVDVQIPLRGIVGPDGIVLKTREKLGTVVEPPKEPTQKFASYVIRDRSLMPMCHDGDVLYYDEMVFNAPVSREAVIGRKCMVQTNNNVMQIAVVVSIGTDGKAVLHLPSGKYREQVTLRRAAPIAWTKHADISITC